MNIGLVAKASGISAKMIRHYESIGLLPIAARTNSGYRDYSQSDIHRLRFIRSARGLGFDFERVRALLALWDDHNRNSADVKALALNHIATLETRAEELSGMIKTLRHLANACEGDHRPGCPILDELQSGCTACGSKPVKATTRGRRRSPASAY